MREDKEIIAELTNMVALLFQYYKGHLHMHYAAHGSRGRKFNLQA